MPPLLVHNGSGSGGGGSSGSSGGSSDTSDSDTSGGVVYNDDPNALDLGQANPGAGVVYNANESEASVVDANPTDPGGPQVIVTDGPEGAESNRAQSVATDLIVNATGGEDNTVNPVMVDATDAEEVMNVVQSGREGENENTDAGPTVSTGSESVPVVVLAGLALIVGYLAVGGS